MASYPVFSAFKTPTKPLFRVLLKFFTLAKHSVTEGCMENITVSFSQMRKYANLRVMNWHDSADDEEHRPPACSLRRLAVSLIPPSLPLLRKNPTESPSASEAESDPIRPNPGKIKKIAKKGRKILDSLSAFQRVDYCFLAPRLLIF